MRKITNLVNLKNLKKKPCDPYLRGFDDDGFANVFELFKNYGQQYEWLYQNSDLDFIGWEVKNRVFDWKNHSEYLVRYASQYFDRYKFNWKNCSWAVAEHCPEHFDSDFYNWDQDSWAVIKYCPEKFDATKYNWAMQSCYVEYYSPELSHKNPYIGLDTEIVILNDNS